MSFIVAARLLETIAAALPQECQVSIVHVPGTTLTPPRLIVRLCDTTAPLGGTRCWDATLDDADLRRAPSEVVRDIVTYYRKATDAQRALHITEVKPGEVPPPPAAPPEEHG